jgi:hypothetical protein
LIDQSIETHGTLQFDGNDVRRHADLARRGTRPVIAVDALRGS